MLGLGLNLTPNYNRSCNKLITDFDLAKSIGFSPTQGLVKD